MPTYEYKCRDCGVRFEQFQSIAADPVQECPECTGSVKRLISAGAGVIFKGSGFYITDYRSDGYKESAKKDKDSSSGSKDSSSAKKDSSSDSKGSAGGDSKSSKTTSSSSSSDKKSD